MSVATDLMSIDQAVAKCLEMIAEREREEAYRRIQAEEVEAKARFNYAVELCEEVAHDYGLALDPSEIVEYVQYSSVNLSRYRLYWRITPQPIEGAKVEALVAEQERRYYDQTEEDRKRWFAARWIYDAGADLSDEDVQTRDHDSLKTDNFVAAITFAVTGHKLPDRKSWE